MSDGATDKVVQLSTTSPAEMGYTDGVYVLTESGRVFSMGDQLWHEITPPDCCRTDADAMREASFDLYEACKAALPILKRWENDGELATAMVEAALAKAEGRG